MAREGPSSPSFGGKIFKHATELVLLWVLRLTRRRVLRVGSWMWCQSSICTNVSEEPVASKFTVQLYVRLLSPHYFLIHFFLTHWQNSPLNANGLIGSPIVPLQISIYHVPFSALGPLFYTGNGGISVFSEMYLSNYKKTRTKRQHTSLEMFVCDFHVEIDLNVFIYFQRSRDEANRYSEPHKKERLASTFWRQSLRDIDWYNIRYCYNIPLSSGSGFATVHMSSDDGKSMVESKWSTTLQTILEDKL
jgi:hypothetical protein